MSRLLASAAPAAAPISSSGFHVSHIGKSLALAFCVGIAYLVIVILQNWWLRRSQRPRPRPRQPSNRSTAVANSEPDQDLSSQIEAIPVCIYGSCVSHFSDEICPICLAEYADGEKVRTLVKCMHVFHKECIDRWFLTRSSFCPVCRSRAINRTVEPIVFFWSVSVRCFWNFARGEY